MIKKILILFIVILMIPLTVICKDRNLLASKIHWEGIFGSLKKDPSTTYCLMGVGFFRAPVSEDINKVINEWMENHPKAYLVPISILQPFKINNPKSKQVYVWVVDGENNLNLYLVRMGCCPAGTMQSITEIDLSIPESDQNDPEIERYNQEISKLQKDKLLIEKIEYNEFITKVTEAEEQAKKDKLGIWTEDLNKPQEDI